MVFVDCQDMWYSVIRYKLPHLQLSLQLNDCTISCVSLKAGQWQQWGFISLLIFMRILFYSCSSQTRSCLKLLPTEEGYILEEGGTHSYSGNKTGLRLWSDIHIIIKRTEGKQRCIERPGLRFFSPPPGIFYIVCSFPFLCFGLSLFYEHAVLFFCYLFLCSSF